MVLRSLERLELQRRVRVNFMMGGSSPLPKSKKYGDIVVATVVRNSGTGGTYSATIYKKVIEAWYSRFNRDLINPISPINLNSNTLLTLLCKIYSIRSFLC